MSRPFDSVPDRRDAPPSVPRRGDVLDEAAIGALVRDAAAAWAMPPTRLDEPTWRDLRGRRSGAASMPGWLGRLGRAATAATVITVAAAIFGVWLTQRPTGVGTESTPPGSATPGTTPVAASLLPKLLVEGELPQPTSVVVELETGDHAIADLATGTLGSPLTGSGWPSEVERLADGSLACICVTPAGWAGGASTRLGVSFVRLDAAGSVITRTDVETLEGSPDPRPDAAVERPSHVLARVTFASGGRYAYVGWSARSHPVWKSGIFVVDLDNGSIVARFELPDSSTGDGDVRRAVDAPNVAGDLGDRLVVARGWYSWQPASSSQPTYAFGVEAFEITGLANQLAGTGPSSVSPLVAATDCGQLVQLAGDLPGGGTWLACRQARATTIRRLDAAGALLGDTRVAGGSPELEMIAATPDGSGVLAWDPLGLRMTRVDLATGRSTESAAIAAATSDGGPLAALGRWLVPEAAAKMILRSGIVLSPDGSIAYAIGHSGGRIESRGSAGVFAFDATTLALVWHVDPVAAFVSLAVSSDGRFIYAAGMAGVDWRGIQSEQPASVTVLDAGDGATRLIAGQLGRGLILFTTATLP